MKSLVLTDVQTLEIQESATPIPGRTEVIVDVHACGVCGTDLHMYHGDKGAFENTFPLVMGHEFSGIISSIGSNVKKLKIGDRVCVDPNLYCGNCRSCLRGQPHFCENMTGYGTTLPGGFSEKCKVDEKAVYKIPDTLSLEHAAMVEPVACCLHGIDRANIHPGDTVALIGAGSIGQIMLQLALCAGAARAVVIEPIPEKREKAKMLGAYLTIDPLTQDVKEEIKNAGIESIDTVIECVGRINTMETAIDIAGNAATVMLFGLTAPNSGLQVLPYEQLFQKELNVTGSFINPLCSQRVIDLLTEKKINIDEVITDKIPLSEAEKVFTDDSYRSHGKILLMM